MSADKYIRLKSYKYGHGDMDSPGGEVSKIEEIYLEVLKLKAKKPVVVSVDGNALSGGYYVSYAANFILVKPWHFVLE